MRYDEEEEVFLVVVVVVVRSVYCLSSRVVPERDERPLLRCSSSRWPFCGFENERDFV